MRELTEFLIFINFKVKETENRKNKKTVQEE